MQKDDVMFKSDDALTVVRYKPLCLKRADGKFGLYLRSLYLPAFKDNNTYIFLAPQNNYIDLTIMPCRVCDMYFRVFYFIMSNVL